MNPVIKVTKALGRAAPVISPNCKQATRLQSESMDRKLSVWEQIGLRVHLLLCKWCRRYRQQLTFIRSAAHHCDDHPPSAGTQALSPEARERIKQKLNLQ